MSLIKSEFNNIKNPVFSNKMEILRDDNKIDLNIYNISKYFREVYILCVLDFLENSVDLNYPFVNKEYFNKCKNNLVLYKVSSKIIKNK